MEKVTQDDRPDRKVYHITDAGRAELLKWLSGPAPLGEPRSAPLIQIFFAGQLSDEQILAKFGVLPLSCVPSWPSMTKSRPSSRRFQQEIESPREQYFWMLTLDNGIRSMRAALEWAEVVIAQIKAGNVPQK